MADSPTYMPVAVRAFTERADPNKEPDDSETDGDDDGKTKGGRRPAPLPEGVLVFDTETTVDETQRLNFGAWRYLRAMWPETGEPRLCCVEEGLFYSDDLPERDPRGYRTLCAYAERERPQVDRGEWDAAWHLPLVPAREFTEEVLHRTAHRARCWVVGFNLPFDLSRLATAVSTSQQYLAGGFSLVLIDYEKDGERRENQWRARLAIKSLDSKRQLIGFKKPAELDEVDQIPDEGGKPDPKNTPRGNFLDVRTLAFALTDRSYSLRSACEEFGTTPKKQGTEAHGRITPRYVGYCRNDVAATTALFGRLMGEYRTHPIALSATKAYSPASVGKAYLKAMGVRPVLKRQPRFDRSVLGHSMVAYYGGRTEVRIRKTVVPVVYVDFLSMYPTVCSLMDLWRLACAKHIRTVDATEAVQRMLDTVTLEGCLAPALWANMVGLVQLAPTGDILPVRAMYRPVAQGRQRAPVNWGIGVNRLHSEEPLWYTIPDAIAASLLTGRPVSILKAVRFEADGVSETLRPVTLPGGVRVDPRDRDQDFFRTVIEERKKLARNLKLSKAERDRLDRFYKVLANSSSYGIYAEINRETLAAKASAAVQVYGYGRPFTDEHSRTPEVPGEYCFPPIAANITGAARLMLALLERKVTDAGGSYAFCDTDSMAIVAAKSGGIVPCAGGAHLTDDGEQAVTALSWREVDRICESFSTLNPYDQDVVAGSVLEIEKENYATPARKQRRQLYCYAISSKRYVLYTYDRNGTPQVRNTTKRRTGEKWSEHGLGHLLNPADQRKTNRGWIRELWEAEIRRVHDDEQPAPSWSAVPAIGSINVSRPATLDAFEELNRGKHYPESIKPFNFLITAQTANDQIPPTVDGAFQLIAPWTNEPEQWLDAHWINKNSTDARFYQTVTGRVEDSDTQVSIRTFADVIADYRVHPESKSLAPDGGRSGWHTTGLLRRRPVKASRLVLIGKESNEIEETMAGLDLGESEQTRQYAKPGDVWRALVKPILAQMPLGELARRSELRATALKNARTGRSLPHPRNQRLLLTIAADWAGEHLRHWGVGPPSLPVDRLAAYTQERSNHSSGRTCPVCGKPVDNPRATYCLGGACKQQAHRDRGRSQREHAVHRDDVSRKDRGSMPPTSNRAAPAPRDPEL